MCGGARVGDHEGNTLTSPTAVFGVTCAGCLVRIEPGGRAPNFDGFAAVRPPHPPRVAMMINKHVARGEWCPLAYGKLRLVKEH